MQMVDIDGEGGVAGWIFGNDVALNSRSHMSEAMYIYIYTRRYVVLRWPLNGTTSHTASSSLSEGRDSLLSPVSRPLRPRHFSRGNHCGHLPFGQALPRSPCLNGPVRPGLHVIALPQQKFMAPLHHTFLSSCSSSSLGESSIFIPRFRRLSL